MTPHTQGRGEGSQRHMIVAILLTRHNADKMASLEARVPARAMHVQERPCKCSSGSLSSAARC